VLSFLQLCLRIPHTRPRTAPAVCPLPPLCTAVSSCFLQPRERKGGGALERHVRPPLAQRSRGSPRVRNVEPPPCPRRTPLFVYPAAQLAVPRPEVAWGPGRARRGERRLVPASCPARELPEAGREGKNSGASLRGSGRRLMWWAGRIVSASYKVEWEGRE
jgi:hypothetical protein